MFLAPMRPDDPQLHRKFAPLRAKISLYYQILAGLYSDKACIINNIPAFIIKPEKIC